MAQQDLQHGLLQVPAPQDSLCSTLLVLCMSLRFKPHSSQRPAQNKRETPKWHELWQLPSTCFSTQALIEPSTHAHSASSNLCFSRKRLRAATSRAFPLVVIRTDKPLFYLLAHVWDLSCEVSGFELMRLSGRANMLVSSHTSQQEVEGHLENHRAAGPAAQLWPS